MSYKPSDSYSKEFVTSSPTTGAATNADSLPVATADFDGSGTGSMALTVTNLDAGRYKVTGTVPAGRLKGDVLNVSVAATVGGVAGKAVVDTQVIDSKRVGDLNDLAATAIVSGGAITTSGGKVSGVALVDTLTTYTGNTVQTGDAFARIGSLGSGLTAVGDTSGTTTLLGRLSSGRATNLDNLTNLDVPVSGRMATFSYIAPPSLASITAGVWDQATSGHTTSGTFGAAMNAAGSAGDPWATTLPGAYGVGTAGYAVGHNLDAQVSTRSVYAGGAVASVTAPVTAGTVTDKTGYSLTVAPPTAAAIATAVLTDTADNTTAGSPGKILAQLLGAFTGTTSVFTAAALVDAPGGTGGGGDPWATAQPGSYATGTFGGLVATTLGRVSGMLAADGLGGYQFTAKALANGPTGSGGTGAIVVNQDTGGVDNLTYRAFSGAGIGGATVRAYLAAEWASNPLTAAVRGEVQTVVTGRWAGVMMLDPAAYVFTFQQPGASGVDTKAVTIS